MRVAQTPKGQADRRQVAETIRQLMRAKSVTVLSLSEQLGVTEQSTYDRLAGRVGITAEELVRIAEVLRVAPGVLFITADEVRDRVSTAFAWNARAA